MEYTEHTREQKLESFGRLLDILDELRVKCPWDRKQTLTTLRPQTIEETYELSDALLHEDLHEIQKELGDLLLHVAFYSKIGTEKKAFDIADVCQFICDKLIYRHPHVFGDVKVSDAAEVIQNWEKLKTREKDGNKRVLSGVPETMPSVLKACRMQEKAAAVGFDWESREQVWDKVHEELGEFREAYDASAEAISAADAAVKACTTPESASEAQAHRDRVKAAAESEMGDVLFSIINASRLYGINPDTALEKTCEKFRRRFTYLEEHTIRAGRDLSSLSLSEMDALWNEAKTLE